MRWIRISNSTDFDVQTAINLLGASVKVVNNAIGLYGSGAKYALAQSVRQDVPVKIVSEGQLYNVVAGSQEFRGKSFTTVVLRTNSGKVVKTPLTTDFGKEDWKDRWFIFREFVSNAMDEAGYCISLVDNLRIPATGTHVYLPYDTFGPYYENMDKWFKASDSTFKVGTGRCYKKGVFVGQLEGLNVDYFRDSLQITETRTLDRESAFLALAWSMRDENSVDIWEAFLSSTKEVLERIGITRTQDMECVHKAMIRVYGEEYCIVPKITEFIEDCEAQGYRPVVLPDGWNLCGEPLVCYLKLKNNKVTRKMTDKEQVMYDKVRHMIRDVIPASVQSCCRIVNDEGSKITGSTMLSTGEIVLNEKVFENEMELIRTMIHEFGHVITKRSDYDKLFTEFFVNKLAELCKILG